MAKLASSSGFALEFLRRLLCARSAGNADDPAALRGAATPRHLPTPETEPRSPCIVARLMGLDAMPAEAPHAQPPPPLPLRRSRSASSADGSPSPWDAQQQQQPRVVRASASLREKPAYLRQENDEFLLLSFSPEDHRGRDVQEELEFLLAAAESTRRGERGPDGARKQRRSGHCRKLVFGDDEAVSSSGCRRRTPAPECDTQNSSPVSVLEVRDAQEESSTTTTSASLEEVEHAEPCSATSDEAQNTLEQHNSRSKLHADFDQFDNLSPARSSCHASRCSDRERRNRRVVNKAEVIAPDVTGIWQPICRLVEEDLKNMKWLVQDGANVVAEMESGILDHLIREMMDELVQGMSETVGPFPLRSKKQLGAKNAETRRAIGCY